MKSIYDAIKAIKIAFNFQSVLPTTTDKKKTEHETNRFICAISGDDVAVCFVHIHSIGNYSTERVSSLAK